MRCPRCLTETYESRSGRAICPSCGHGSSNAESLDAHGSLPPAGPADKSYRAGAWTLDIYYRAKGEPDEGQHGIAVNRGHAVEPDEPGRVVDTDLGRLNCYGRSDRWPSSLITGWHFADQRRIRASTDSFERTLNEAAGSGTDRDGALYDVVALYQSISDREREEVRWRWHGLRHLVSLPDPVLLSRDVEGERSRADRIRAALIAVSIPDVDRYDKDGMLALEVELEALRWLANDAGLDAVALFDDVASLCSTHTAARMRRMTQAQPDAQNLLALADLIGARVLHRYGLTAEQTRDGRDIRPMTSNEIAQLQGH